MEIRINRLLRSAALAPALAIFASSFVHAATVDTTVGTTVLNVDNPLNKYIGNGTLQVSANGADVIVELGTSSAPANTEFALTSGDIITIDSGAHSGTAVGRRESGPTTRPTCR